MYTGACAGTTRPGGVSGLRSWFGSRIKVNGTRSNALTGAVSEQAKCCRGAIRIQAGRLPMNCGGKSRPCGGFSLRSARLTPPLRAGNQRRRCPPLEPTPIASTQAFCHCSANCIQNCIGFIAGPAKESALGQAPAGQAPAGLASGQDFSLDSIADDAVIGFGDLICSSQTSIMLSRA
jgi:hypothetical protein